MTARDRQGIDIDFQAINAKKLLDQKVRETITKCGVAGLGAVLVSQDGIGNLSWTTKLKDVFPEIQSIDGVQAQYFNVTLEQLMAHASGMGTTP